MFRSNPNNFLIMLTDEYDPYAQKVLPLLCGRTFQRIIHCWQSQRDSFTT